MTHEIKKHVQVVVEECFTLLGGWGVRIPVVFVLGVGAVIGLIGGDVEPFAHHNSGPEQLYARPIQTTQFSPLPLQIALSFPKLAPQTQQQCIMMMMMLNTDIKEESKSYLFRILGVGLHLWRHG